jgi:hypothetical protein
MHLRVGDAGLEVCAAAFGALFAVTDVLPLLPGLKANIRKSAIANPACSSGANDKSARLVIAI